MIPGKKKTSARIALETLLAVSHFFFYFLPLGASLRWARSHQVRPCIVHLGIFVCGNLTSGPLVRRKAELELLVTNQP